MADRTPIIVAAIGLIGVISAAAIANPKNVRDLIGLGETRRDTVTPTAPAVQPTPPSTGTPDISGHWKSDGDLSIFTFAQSGTTFTYRQLDTTEDEGHGTIAGNRLRYAFTTPQGSGTCEATFDAASNTIAGTCTRGGETWPVSLRRPRPKELHRDF